MNAELKISEWSNVTSTRLSSTTMITYSETIDSLASSNLPSEKYATLFEVMRKDRDSIFIPGQGFAIDKKYYHYSQNNPQRQSPLRWIDYRLGWAENFLTANALVVLKLGGRLRL
jgi:hypothetical protein